MSGMIPASQLLIDTMKTVDFEGECVSTGAYWAQLDFLSASYHYSLKDSKQQLGFKSTTEPHKWERSKRKCP